MERSLLLIVGIVFLVGAIGFMSISSNGITGNAVYEQQPSCDACTGTPVCAAKLGRVTNYPNACAAECEGAKVVYDNACERIPRAALE
jgi:hypothetical protein